MLLNVAEGISNVVEFNEAVVVFEQYQEQFNDSLPLSSSVRAIFMNNQ